MQILAAIAVLLLAAASSPSPAAEPVARAHAHNDYLHPRPLLDALEQGFCSVEADIHLVDGKLIVAHDLPKGESSLNKQPPRTLRNLYLEPLAKRVRDKGGRVFADNSHKGRVTTSPFLLLIDLKTEADITYAALRKDLLSYKEIL